MKEIPRFIEDALYLNSYDTHIILKDEIVTPFKGSLRLLSLELSKMSL